MDRTAEAAHVRHAPRLASEPELECLRAALARASAEGPVSLLFHGIDPEASDALRERMLRGSLGALHVLAGESRSGRPFAPLVTITRDALERLGPHGLDAHDEAGLACADGCHARFWDHGDARPSGIARPVPLSRRGFVPSEKRLRLFDSIRAVLRALAGTAPVVLWIDHADRIDRASLDVLAHVLDVGEHRSEARVPVVVLGCMTKALADVAPRDDGTGWTSLPRCESLRAGRLDEPSLRAALQRDDVVRWLLARTGGDIARLQRWLETDAPESAPPALPSAERGIACDALKLAAMLGRSIPLVAIEHDPTDRERLGRALARMGALEWSGGAALVAWPRPAPAVEDAERASVHAKCARVLTNLAELDEAAWHAARGDDPLLHASAALAVEPLLRARHAQPDAALLLAAARDRLVSAGDEPELTRIRLELDDKIVDVSRAIGDSNSALAAARRVCAARPDDARAQLRLGEVLSTAGLQEASIQVFERCAQLAGGDDRLACEAQCLAADVLVAIGRCREAEKAARTTLALASRVGDVALEADARNVLGKVALQRGDHPGARALFEENVAIASRHGLREHECVAHQNVGIAWLLAGSNRDAKRALDRSAELAEEAGAAWHRAIALENLAVLDHMRGEWRSASTRYEQALGLLERIGHRNWLGRLLFNLADLSLDLGDAPRARDLATKARASVSVDLRRPVHVSGLMVEGGIHLELGREDLARLAFEEVVLIGHENGDAATVLRGTLALAQCALMAGEPARARALLDGAPVAPAGRMGAEHASVEADIAVAFGTPSIALARAAVERAIEAEHPRYVLRGHVRLAQILTRESRDDAARESIRAAAEMEARLAAEIPEASRELFLARADSRALRQLSSPATARPAIANETVQTSSIAARELVGTSRVMRELRALVARVGTSDARVLLLGESGTGKELVAEALHASSKRARGPLVRVNCAALVETLLLSELFGHERGAFTGAHTRRIGRFEAAEGGTLFLDEIGDISPRTQAALLRVLQERTFERVGGTSSISVDVRVIAATHRPLASLVARGEFREDLYYRLRGMVIEVPPLRERSEDVPLLASHLLDRIATSERIGTKRLSTPAAELLSAHTWPGNVRELENVLRSASVLASSDVIEAEDVIPQLSIDVGAPAQAQPAREDDLAQLYWRQVCGNEASIYELRKTLERGALERAISEAGGNLAEAARRLGMKRPRLSQLAKEYGIGGRK